MRALLYLPLGTAFQCCVDDHIRQVVVLVSHSLGLAVLSRAKCRSIFPNNDTPLL